MHFIRNITRHNIATLHSTGDWDTSSGDLSVCTDDLHDGLFVPVSEIKAARRKALAMLVEATKLHEKDKGVSAE